MKDIHKLDVIYTNKDGKKVCQIFGNKKNGAKLNEQIVVTSHELKVS